MTDRLIIAAALLLAGFAGGWVAQGWRAEARISAMDAAQRARDAQAADLIAQAERDNRARLERAAAAADAAVVAANARAAAADRQAQELRHALETATSATRPCLSGAAVRLLNTPATPGAGNPGLRLLARSASPAAAAATAATDPGEPAASERDIAGWIVTARQMYDACSARVDAIRQWQEQAADE